MPPTPRLCWCHQCLCFVCFTTHPPRFTTQSQSLWSWSCPCPHSFSHSHTHRHGTPPRHTHTRVVAGPLWCLVCVCVSGHGVGSRRAWLATHQSTHSLCPTPHHSSSCCCCCWWWWMWWWQRGCCGVCGHLVHPLAVLVLSTPLPLTHTHTGWWARGGGGCVCVVWLPPPLCPIPTNHHHCVRCPALSAVRVRVRGGTRHSGALWWHPRWCVCVWLCVRRAHHTHHPRCPPLSPLSPRSPHPTPATHTHTWHASRHTHMACFVCLLPSTHTHWLPHCPHARHTHTPLGVRAPIHLLSSATTHTHTRDAQAWRMHGWLGVWSPPPRPLCPPLTHTQRDWWWAPWWCVVVWVWAVCASHATNHHAIPPTTTTNALVPPPPTHTHTGLGGCTTATHTRHMHHHTHQRVLCGAHTMPLTHTRHQPHTPTMVLAIAHHAVHTHTQRMPHTHHTGEGPRARTPVGVAFGEPPPPRWSWAFAVLCWWLLVHQPLFTLTHPSTPTPSSPNHHHHHPIHPVCVVWCVVWERTAPGTTVVVKHATHTPVVHCVHGSHHPTLHPPLTPLLVLFPPPTTTPSLFSTHHHHHTHTTRPLWSSTAHSSASHTHTWCGWHVALWLLSRAV